MTILKIIIATLLIIINIPIYKWRYKRTFKSKEEYYKAEEYENIPGPVSVFKGDYLKRAEAIDKLRRFRFWITMAVLLELYAIMKILSMLEISLK